MTDLRALRHGAAACRALAVLHPNNRERWELAANHLDAIAAVITKETP